MLVPSTVRVSSHAPSTNSQLQGAGASCQRQFIAFPEEHSREISVPTARTNPLPIHCFPRAQRKGFGRGRQKPPSSRGVSEPLSPAPFLPGDRQPYRRSGLGRLVVQFPSWERAPRLAFPRHSLYSARPHKGNKRLGWLKGCGGERAASTAVQNHGGGWEAPAFTKFPRIAGTLGSDTHVGTTSASPEGKPHLSSSWVLQGY